MIKKDAMPLEKSNPSNIKPENFLLAHFSFHNNL